MLVIAHRGASYLAPENTLASVKLAWELNSDVVEIDVRLTRDNRVVVMHDASTKRTGGEDLVIAESNSDDLRKLDVGRYKDEKYAEERIPFLEEVIEAVPPGKKLFVEIKSGLEILPFVTEIIRSSGKASQMVIIGFDLETMTQAKKMMDSNPVYWLRGLAGANAFDPRIIPTAKDRGLDGLNLYHSGVDQSFAQMVKDAGLNLCVWTVNDPEEALRLSKCRVDGITSDCPDVIMKHLGRT